MKDDEKEIVVPFLLAGGRPDWQSREPNMTIRQRLIQLTRGRPPKDPNKRDPTPRLSRKQVDFDDFD